MNYLKLYNHHIPQRVLDAKTPILALKEWQQKRPELFVKRVYDQAGLDSYEQYSDQTDKKEQRVEDCPLCKYIHRPGAE